MENLVDEFNTTSCMCVEFILSVTDDDDLKFYKKAMVKIIEIDKIKIIEQFIIYCLPHYDYIINNDENYFINLNSTDMDVNKDSFIEILKPRKYLVSLDKNMKELIFEYLKLLCKASKQYLQYKLKNKKHID